MALKWHYGKACACSIDRIRRFLGGFLKQARIGRTMFSVLVDLMMQIRLLGVLGSMV